MRNPGDPFETIVDLDRMTGGFSLGSSQWPIERKCIAEGWVVERNPKDGKLYSGIYGSSGGRYPLPENMKPEEFCK